MKELENTAKGEEESMEQCTGYLESGSEEGVVAYPGS
jgi:hypothetical protein